MKPIRLFAVTLATALFVSGSAAPAPVPADKDEAKAELERLAGTWKVVSIKKEGVELIADQDDPPELVITFKKDGSFEWAKKGGDPGMISNIDPSKKPKEVDYVFSAGDNKGKTQKAIYKLDGDTFSDCFTEVGEKERPTEFKSTKTNGYTVIVYKRMKKVD